MIGNISSIYTQNNLAVTNVTAANPSMNNGKSQDIVIAQEVNKEYSQSASVTISEEALNKLKLDKESKETEKSSPTSGFSQLSSKEAQQVAELKSRDREVRTHEMAHMMVGGSLVRKGASYQYQTGPDGQRYAVGGEVSIDSSAVSGDPSATIRKMQQVKRAALAPAEPSSQDRAVAAAAAQTEAAARLELLQQSAESTITEE
jgi:ribosomal protein L11